MKSHRYIVSLIVSVAGSFLIWNFLVVTVPIFSRLSLIGLIPVCVAGMMGGGIAGLFSARYKVFFAAAVGTSLAVFLLCFMVYRGMYAEGRSVIVWFWPAYFAPTFIVGGLLAKRWGPKCA